MTPEVPVPKYLDAIPAYKAGLGNIPIARETKKRLGHLIKLSSNENPSGMSPRTKEVLAKLHLSDDDDPSRYPDPDATDLRNLLGKKLGVPLEWLTIGNGSVELVHIAIQAFHLPGTVTVQSQYAYDTWGKEVRLRGGIVREVPAMKDYGHDLDAMLAAIDDKVVSVFLCSPNNPTGNFISKTALEAFLARVPSRVLVMLDEAYIDFVPAADMYDSMMLVRKYPNLLVTRTFSKLYGLAGLRLGYSIAQPWLTELLNRLRPTFNVGVYPLIAGLTALEDDAHSRKTLELNRAGMAQVTRGLDELGVRYLPSKANFVIMQIGDWKKVHRGLLDFGIQVRPITNYGLLEWLRVSIGLPEENEAFLTALKNVLGTNARG